MQSDRFTEIQVGDVAELSHTISAKDVEVFAQLSGDTNPVHMSDEYAAESGIGSRAVHGILTASFISAVIGTRLPGAGALWYEQNFRFPAPVRVGETVRAKVQVKRKSEAQRLILVDTTVLGEDGRTVLEGSGQIRVLASKAAASSVVVPSLPKVVIVTGSARGIGAAICRRLAQDGFAVVVNYRTGRDRALELVEEICGAGGRAIAIGADVSRETECRELVARTMESLGGLGGLVHNAGRAPVPGEIGGLDWKAFEAQFDVGLRAAFSICAAALPELTRAPGGVIVNVGSAYAEGVPPAKLAPYVTGKAALSAFSRCLAVEYGTKGLRVNTVSPGMTETDFLEGVPERARLVEKGLSANRRLGTPDDVAHAVSFLFSPSASHITGQTIRIGGGRSMI